MKDRDEELQITPAGLGDAAAAALARWAVQLQHKAVLQAKENMEEQREQQATEQRQKVEAKTKEETVQETEVNAGLTGEEPPEKEVEQGTYLNIKA